MTTGRCNFFTDMFGPRAGLLFLLHAVFDETECKLHGTNLAPELLSREVNEWTVDGDEIRGLFFVKGPFGFVFPLTCMQTAKFAGAAPNVDFLSLLNKADHAYPNTTSHQLL